MLCVFVCVFVNPVFLFIYFLNSHNLIHLCFYSQDALL